MPRNQGHVKLEVATNGLFYVENFAENGRGLSVTQRFQGGRDEAIGNIAAHLQLFGGEKVLVREYNQSKLEVKAFYVLANGTEEELPVGNKKGGQ